jgi:hypothetical protein
MKSVESDEKTTPFRLDPAKPPRLTPDEASRLAAMTEDDPAALCFRYLLQANAPHPGNPGTMLTYDGYVARDEPVNSPQCALLMQGLAEKMESAHGVTIDPESIVIKHLELRGQMTRAKAAQLMGGSQGESPALAPPLKRHASPSMLTMVNGRFALSFVATICFLAFVLQDPTLAPNLTSNAGWLAAGMVCLSVAFAAWQLHVWLRQRPLGTFDLDDIEHAFRHLPEEEAAARRRGSLSEYDIAVLHHINLTLLDVELKRRGVEGAGAGTGSPISWFWPALPFALDLVAMALAVAVVALMLRFAQ